MHRLSADLDRTAALGRRRVTIRRDGGAGSAVAAVRWAVGPRNRPWEGEADFVTAGRPKSLFLLVKVLVNFVPFVGQKFLAFFGAQPQQWTLVECMLDG